MKWNSIRTPALPKDYYYLSNCQDEMTVDSEIISFFVGG